MKGALLVNLGTPASPSTADVRRYLGEFLDDPRVLDMNTLGRKLLLNLVILPFRPARSAAAYAKIWTDRGSPLLFHSQDLARGVQAELGQGWKVALAMRYGEPTIQAALDELQAAGADDIVLLPLYPHYASSSTGSTMARVLELAARRPVVPTLHLVRDFYDHPAFIDAIATTAAAELAAFAPDRVLFSYHGIPERQVLATELRAPSQPPHCLASEACCDAIVPANRACYRAQCFATSRALATALGLTPDQWQVSFQSRLGRIPWIRPYTDEVLIELAQSGVEKLAVFCPSFVADCLETIEEIGMEGARSFTAAGGKELKLFPCVNSDAAWVRGVVQLVRQGGKASGPG